MQGSFGIPALVALPVYAQVKMRVVWGTKATKLTAVHERGLTPLTSLAGLKRQAKLFNLAQSIFFPFINVQLVPSGIHLSQVRYTEITFCLVTYCSRFPLTRVPKPQPQASSIMT